MEKVDPHTITSVVKDVASHLTTSTGLPLPSYTTVGLACFLPTFLAGMYKREYTVSYGYGTAVATASILILRSLLWPTDVSNVSMHSLAVFHAFILAFYGIRLDLFLLFRETFFPKFKQMREKNQKPVSNDLLKRIPFIVGCSFLYFCLVAPVMITSSNALMQSTTIKNTFKNFSFKDTATLSHSIPAFFMIGSFVSFLIAAIGDFQKSFVKMQQSKQGKDSEHVFVTGGIYSLMRHPNYTGEIFAWSFNALAALTTLAFYKYNHMKLDWINGGLAAASVLGVLGMIQVLTMATSRLEKKQAEKYGDQPEYKEWIKKSWVGFTTPTKSKTH